LSFKVAVRISFLKLRYGQHFRWDLEDKYSHGMLLVGRCISGEEREMFEEFVSKKLIEVIWVLASIGVLINGVVLMLAGGGGRVSLLALTFIAIGLLVVRVACESMIVILMMHENLQRSNRLQSDMVKHLSTLGVQLLAAPASRSAAPASVSAATPVPAGAQAAEAATWQAPAPRI
jgi:hypothetical protein